MKYLFSFLILLLLAPCLSHNDGIPVQGTDRILPLEPLPVSSLTGGREPSRGLPFLARETRSFDEANLGEFAFRFYITPEDQCIKSLASEISGPGDAYQLSVQWAYVSDLKLNQIVDKWLTPNEFLVNTPRYPGNPLQGEIVSDCEEKANTLVSLIRAKGIQPEEVRVVTGEVMFSDAEGGHAWVELLTDGYWLALDPSWGPYWDDRYEKLVCRQGVPFDYYVNHAYPVLKTWTYYNDVYFLNASDGSGNTPAWWHRD